MRHSHRFASTATAALLLALSAAPAAAQRGGIAGFSFLHLEPSARAAALGGAASPLYEDDIGALFYNPAALNEAMHGGLSLSYVNHLSDLNAGFLAYGRNVAGLGTLAGGLRFLSWGDMQERDETGEALGTFGASDVALTLGYARPYSQRIRFGVNAHAILSSVASYRATALAADVGALYTSDEGGTTFGASLHNVGFVLSSLGDTRDELPLDLRVTASKQLAYLPLLVSITGHHLHEIGGDHAGADATGLDALLRHVAVGGEFRFSDAFHLRVGYNHDRHQMLKMKSRLDLAGVGIGFGLRVARLRLDYAYNTWSDAGSLHHFTLRSRL